jgi:hypothetical protein
MDNECIALLPDTRPILPLRAGSAALRADSNAKPLFAQERAGMNCPKNADSRVQMDAEPIKREFDDAPCVDWFYAADSVVYQYEPRIWYEPIEDEL